MLPWNIETVDFDSDAKLNNIRQSWLKGQWPEECFSCKNVELSGNKSRRQTVESWATDNNITDLSVELLRIDYWLGNTCNLRCPSCGPKESIAWQAELGIKSNVIKNKEWRNLNLEKLKWVHFTGGEPLLIDHIDFLNAIPNKNSVTVNYNTNATVRPKDNLLKVLEQFKLVQMDCSIDGIEERFEYLRYPAKWSTVKENLFWFRNTLPVNFMFDINATVSILNTLTIDVTENWFKENFNTNRLGDPVKFRKQNANGILSVDSNIKEVINYLDALDARRKTNWRETFPELVLLVSPNGEGHG